MPDHRFPARCCGIARLHALLAAGLILVAGCGGSGDDNGARLPDFGAQDVACGLAFPLADLSGVQHAAYVDAASTVPDGQPCGATPEQACPTLARGIAACAEGQPGCGVLVRHGHYTVASTVAIANGIGVYGSCRFGDEGDVTPATPYRSVIEAVGLPSGAPALSASGITAATVVEGLTVLGPNQTATDGAASIAVTVSGSSGLVMRRNVLVAGVGAPGRPAGATPAVGSSGGGQNGNNVSGGGGAGGGTACTATPDLGAGGQGGDGQGGGPSFVCIPGVSCPCEITNPAASRGQAGAGSGSLDGGPGGGLAAYGAWCTGAGDPNGSFLGQSGRPGNNGACAADGGASSADVWGQLQAGLWAATAAGTGPTGQAGSGGGGGSSGGLCVNPDLGANELIAGVPGGGGGAGGCGGPGGQGGGQGGASMAALLIDAAVTGLNAGAAGNLNSLITGLGGRGANGGTGAQGAAGMPGGLGSTGGFYSVGNIFIQWSCPGRAGGGGSGGGGGGGAGGAAGNGGPSLGLGLSGSSPALADDTRIYTGTPGGPGAQGPGGAGATGNCDGATGAPGRTGGGDFQHRFN